MNFIEFKEYFIDLDKVSYIDFRYEEDEYVIFFQLDSVDEYLLFKFKEYIEYKYWIDYLRKKINC